MTWIFLRIFGGVLVLTVLYIVCLIASCHKEKF